MHLRYRLLAAALVIFAGSCQRSIPPASMDATPSPTRAERRAYAGAPPVIAHKPLGNSCNTCHSRAAREVPGIGIAPANPHLHTLGLSEASRCQQCHVFKASEVLVASDFRGLAQDLRHGERLYEHAPPVIPHHLFMREDCAACHTGSAARPEVRCTHPERMHCLQCHARSGRSVRVLPNKFPALYVEEDLRRSEEGPLFVGIPTPR